MLSLRSNRPAIPPFCVAPALLPNILCTYIHCTPYSVCMYDMAENKPMVSGSTSLPPLHPRTPLPIPGPPPYTCRMPFAQLWAYPSAKTQRTVPCIGRGKKGVVWCGMVCICMAVPIPRCIKPARMMPLCVCMHRSFYACKYVVCTYAQST